MKNDSKLNARSKDFTRDVIKIKVSFSKWGGELNSDRAAEAAARAEHADKNRIKAKVVAVPASVMAPINTAFGAVAKYWRWGDGNGFSGTKPWEDGGWRLGLSSEYGAGRQRLDQLVREATDAVRAHIGQNYDTIKADAEKQLGALVQGRFPSKVQLLAKYDIRVFTDTLTSPEDIRFSGMTDAEAQAVVKAREEYYETLITESNRDMLADAVVALSNLRETLEDPDKRFNGCEELGYPIVDAVHKMIDRAEKFNLSGDAKLVEMIAKARKALAEIDLTQAKSDPKARQDCAKKAKSLEDELAAF